MSTRQGSAGPGIDRVAKLAVKLAGWFSYRCAASDMSGNAPSSYSD
jgi:hypothetical protein